MAHPSGELGTLAKIFDEDAPERIIKGIERSDDAIEMSDIENIKRDSGITPAAFGGDADASDSVTVADRGVRPGASHAN